MASQSLVIETFARDIVANAFDQAIDATIRAAQRAERGIEAEIDRSPSPQPSANRDLAIAVAAAESALASFFSNLELVGGAKVAVDVGSGHFLDLDDVLGEPTTAFFFRDGWLTRYSKYSDQVARWQKE